MSEQCKAHTEVMTKVYDRINESNKDITDIKVLQATTQNDITWIKENIKTAIDSKRWAIGTILAVIALGVALIK